MKTFFLCCLLVAFITTTKADSELTIAAPEDVIRDYHLFLNGKSPQHIQSFKGEKSRRDVVELVLVQQAIALGGFTGKIKIIDAPSDARINEMMKNGQADISGTSYWKEDVNPENQIASDIVIKQGQFEAGFYTSPKNTKALSAKDLIDLQKLIAISNQDWKPDWNALQALRLKHLEHVVLWESMVKMVDKGRGDFTLAPFQQTKDMSLESNGVKLIPIPKLKIALSGNRSYLVSKNGIIGQEILPLLNKGIKELQKKKVFEKAYRESGFFNPRVRNWKRVN